MVAKLEAIAGPRKGEIFRVKDSTLSIGRDPSNHLAVLDSALSRHHCQIEERGDQYAIRDLDSRNGTLLNGAALKEKMLQDGDEIKIGASIFIFRWTDEASAISNSGIKELVSAGNSTIVLRKEDALYLSSPAHLKSMRPTNRAVRDLNALLRISQAVNSVHHIEDLEKQIVEAIFEVSPARRAAILSIDPRNGEVVVATVPNCTLWVRAVMPVTQLAPVP